MALFSWLKKAPPAAAPVPAPALDAAQRAAALKAQGNALLDEGKFDAAAAIYEKAVALMPQDPDSRINAGFALAQLQRHAQAEDHLRVAVRLDPGSFDALYVLAGVVRAQGDPGQAIGLMRKALAVKPEFEACRRDLVHALFEAGELAAAQEAAVDGLRLHPDSATLHQYLGNLHASGGRWEEAAASYSSALKIRPADASLLSSLADALKSHGDLPAALEALRQAAAASPASADVRLRLGAALHENGQLDAALAVYRQAIALDPLLAGAHSNMGAALQQQGHLAAAIECCRKAIVLKPDFAAAHSNLGNALQQEGELVEAVASYRKALALLTDANSRNNLAGALLAQGQLDEAIVELRAALLLQPGDLAAASNLLFALNYHPDKAAEEIFEDYRDFERRLTRSLAPVATRHRNDRNPDRRLRIGYVSPDFRHHPVRYFLQPLIENHDKGSVEVYAYAESAIVDSVTTRYRESVEHWVPTLGMSNDALAQRIRDDRIDILVDLAGHTGNNRLAMFALKPAPVALSWLGYGYTTGLSAIDYYLTDPVNAPVGCEGLFAEIPWRMATPCYAFRPNEGVGAVSPLPAMLRGGVTFGTLTRAIRVNHRTMRVWSRILQQLPGSRLVLDSQNFKQSAMQVQIAEQFAAHGIDSSRIQVGFSTPPWDVLRGIDIGLDCFPHNSGTTLFESLYMGLPFVTLAGRPSVGRLGSSILHGVGHPEWIAQSEAEYVDKAVALASDLPRLAQLRSGLRAEMQASALMDESGFARKVEAAYREMFARWVEHAGP